MPSTKSERKRISHLLACYHRLCNAYRESGDDFYYREMQSTKRSLSHLGVFFYYIPPIGQKSNDCWYVAFSKISAYSEPKRWNTLSEWYEKVLISDIPYPSNSPYHVWKRDEGLSYLEEHNILTRLGLKPVPREMHYFVEEEKIITPYYKMISKRREMKKISCDELKEDLQQYGPLWCRVRGPSLHATVLVGVGKDYVILNDSAWKTKEGQTKGKIWVVAIEKFNDVLDKHGKSNPFWYFSVRWTGFDRA